MSTCPECYRTHTGAPYTDEPDDRPVLCDKHTIKYLESKIEKALNALDRKIDANQSFSNMFTDACLKVCTAREILEGK